MIQSCLSLKLKDTMISRNDSDFQLTVLLHRKIVDNFARSIERKFLVLLNVVVVCIGFFKLIGAAKGPVHDIMMPELIFLKR